MACEWALMRKLDSKLGRIEAVDEVEDAMLARASILGGEHEARALANYKTQFPGTVVEIETEDARADPEILRNAQARTIEALQGGIRGRLSRLHSAAAAEASTS